MRKAQRKTQAQHVGLSRRDCLKAGVAGGIGLAGLSRLGAGTQEAMAQDSKPKTGGTLVVRSGPVRGIDPHFETWAATLQVVHQTYNGLVKFTPDGTTIVPDLAESWQQKNDLTYIFQLHKGVRFHDVPPVKGRE